MVLDEIGGVSICPTQTWATRILRLFECESDVRGQERIRDDIARCAEPYPTNVFPQHSRLLRNQIRLGRTVVFPEVTIMHVKYKALLLVGVVIRPHRRTLAADGIRVAAFSGGERKAVRRLR